MKSLGIDPGEKTSGYGFVEVYGRHERALEWGEVESTREAFAALYRRLMPDLVTVEDVVIYRLQASKVLLRVKAVSERAATVAGMLDIAATTMAQDVWRPIVGVRKKRKGAVTTDAAVDRVLRMRLQGFPEPRKSSNHERDALGLALAGGLKSTVAQFAGTWIHGGGQR